MTGVPLQTSMITPDHHYYKHETLLDLTKEMYMDGEAYRSADLSDGSCKGKCSSDDEGKKSDKSNDSDWKGDTSDEEGNKSDTSNDSDWNGDKSDYNPDVDGPQPDDELNYVL